MAEKKKQRQAKRRNLTGKRILRDSWLAPLTLSPKLLAEDSQVTSYDTNGLGDLDAKLFEIKCGTYDRVSPIAGEFSEFQ